MYTLVYKTVQNEILENKNYFGKIPDNVQNGIRLGL